jgi:hypothetical protein
VLGSLDTAHYLVLRYGVVFSVIDSYSVNWIDMKARVLASILCSLLIVSITHAQQKTTAQWKEYIYPNDGFALSLPRSPKISQSVALPGATAYAAYLESDDIGFVLRVMRTKRNQTCTAALNTLKERLLSGSDTSVDLSSLKEPSLDGTPGLEYLRRLKTKIAIDRYYCANQRLYSFTVDWPSGRPLPAAATRMLDSFRVVQQQ